jgi:trimeric autotransporter adhesin
MKSFFAFLLNSIAFIRAHSAIINTNQKLSTMKKLFFLLVVLWIYCSSSFAQIGFNNDGAEPDPSAGLDVKFTDLGLLIPRIALEQTTLATPVTAPAVSLLVFNTETINDVTPGYYYWDGTAWVKLSIVSGGSGTSNYMTKWTATGSLGNSQVFDDGTNIGVGTTTPGAMLDVAGRIWQTSTGQSVFIGEGAGANDDLSNNQSVFVGYMAGNSNTTGEANTATGFRALPSNTTGKYNTAYGLYALHANTTGEANTAIGSGTMMNNTTGNLNTALGVYVLLRNTEGWFNTATGYESLNFNTTGSNNTANGNYALLYNETGSNNTANGSSALRQNTTGTYNTASGYYALNNNTTGHYNTALGCNAGVASGSGNLINATAIGANAIVGASDALVLGNNANVGIGTSTPSAKLDVIGTVKITDGSQGANKVLTSDASGLASWQAPSSGWSLAGNAGTVAGTNFIGTTDNAAFDIRTNNVIRARITTKGAIETYNTGNSVYIGQGAGAAAEPGDLYNVFIGFQAGLANTTGYYNTASGFYALKANTTGYVNTAIGTQALYFNTTGLHNTANGYAALLGNLTGNFNTASGTQALDANTSGSNNTALGYSADVAAGDLTNATAIGANAIVGASDALVLGNNANVGIGTSTPSAKLDVIGTVKITDGSQGANKVLTSDASGLASWQAPSSGWSLLGNAGTVAGTNFIGTTDDVAFDIRTNNVIRARITTKGAIEPLNTGESVFIGEGAGAAYDATGVWNVFVGWRAGMLNTAGTGNIAIGLNSMGSNISGNENTAIGIHSNSANITGKCNSAVGGYSLQNNTSGEYNTTMGYTSLYNNSTGNYNTAIGTQSLYSNTTGSFNTAIGYNADVTTDNLSNATAIGNGAIVDASNKIILGNASAITVGGYGTWTNYSDKRFKENIRYKNDLGLDFIMKLKTASYNYIDDQNKRRRDGLIAQDVQQTLNDLGLEFSGLVIDDNEMKTMNLSYGEFVIPLINATQELSGQLKEALDEIEALKSENNNLKVENEEIIETLNGLKAQIEIINGYLGVSSLK